MSFTTICPACGMRFLLLPKFLNCKVMCDECHKPFIAADVGDPMVEVADGAAPLPKEGWLVVCPACAHTQLVPREKSDRAHCSVCDSALTIPVVASKKVRRKKTGKKTRRRPPGKVE